MLLPILLAGFCLILCVSVGLMHFCLLIVTVSGQSMIPTFQDGERLLALRRWPARWLRRRQVVVLQQGMSLRSRLEMLHIKRVEALPGEAFTACPVTIRSAMDDQFITEAPQAEQTWQIPPGHIFVCGDNREQSLDSRTWGPLPQRQVRGVVFMKLSRPAQAPSQLGFGRLVAPKLGLPVGSGAPAFSVSTVEGTIVTSQEYHGRALLFFFFFALPSSMPTLLSRLEAMARRATEAGVAVLFVSASNLEETCRFVPEMPLSRPLLLAHRTQNTLLHDFEVEGMPCYCLVDQEGIVRASGILLNVLEEELDRLSLELALTHSKQQMVEH